VSRRLARVEGRHGGQASGVGLYATAPARRRVPLSAARHPSFGHSTVRFSRRTPVEGADRGVAPSAVGSGQWAVSRHFKVLTDTCRLPPGDYSNRTSRDATDWPSTTISTL